MGRVGSPSFPGTTALLSYCMSSLKQQPIRQVKVYPHVVWYIALKIMKYPVMIVQIKWITNTREQELRRREVGI